MEKDNSGIQFENFKKLDIDTHNIFLDFDLREQFGYKNKQTRFPFSEALKGFLKKHPKIKIYLTNKGTVKDFIQYKYNWLVNIESFSRFCNDIGYYRSDSRRIEAFFGKHISIANLSVSEEDKKKFLKSNVTEKDLLFSIKNLNTESKKTLLKAMLSIKDDDDSSTLEPLNQDDFFEIFSKFLKDKKTQNNFLNKLPEVQLNILEDLLEFVRSNLDKNETFFQNWIDEEKGKYRKTRCMIFGLEYVNPLREGEIMGRKRFDILATQNRENHILIELKSPTADIFEIKEKNNPNGGKSTTYNLSKDLARAIPQILSYKKWYQEMTYEKIEEIGLSEKKSVSDCIIIIGKNQHNEVWKRNFQDLKENLKVKILTYDDLIQKMENTIKNLKENLK